MCLVVQLKCVDVFRLKIAVRLLGSGVKKWRLSSEGLKMAVERSEGTQMNLGRLGGERREGKGEEEREEREEKEEKEERLVNLDIFRVKIQSIFIITHSPILSIKMDNTKYIFTK